MCVCAAAVGGRIWETRTACVTRPWRGPAGRALSHALFGLPRQSGLRRWRILGRNTLRHMVAVTGVRSDRLDQVARVLNFWGDIARFAQNAISIWIVGAAAYGTDAQR